MMGSFSAIYSSFLPTLVPSITSSMILPSTQPLPSPLLFFFLSPESADEVRFSEKDILVFVLMDGWFEVSIWRGYSYYESKGNICR